MNKNAPQVLVVASDNPGKLKELRALLQYLPFVLRPQSEFNVKTPAETGADFVENALIKARHAARATHLPAVADDSGLEVDALGGAPGIFSARYAGAGAKDAGNVAKLLEDLRGFADDALTARFRCAAVFVRNADDAEPVIADACWEGRIVRERKGVNGFGYDPVFQVPGFDCTAAELPPATKNQISHRARAFSQLREQLESGMSFPIPCR